MKVVYLAHPISGDVKGNVEKLKKIIYKINFTEPDVVPFAPYIVDLMVLDDATPQERARGMKNNAAFFVKGTIDEVWVCSNNISEGMSYEIALAESLQIPVKKYEP